MPIYRTMCGILGDMTPFPRTPTPFGDFLLRRMVAAGFTSLAKFARAAGISGSTASRLVFDQEQTPDTSTLERVATTLGVPYRDILLAQADGQLPESVTADMTQAHILAVEIAQMLAEDSPLSADDRHILETLLDRVISLYRPAMRRD